MTATEVDDSQEIAQECRFGVIVVERQRDGWARLRIEGDDVNVWTWPTTRGGDSWQSPAEELAKALALIDGRFEVRRYR